LTDKEVAPNGTVANTIAAKAAQNRILESRYSEMSPLGLT